MSVPWAPYSIRVTVPGAPVGKQRARRSKNGGFYTPDKTVSYESSVAMYARRAMEGESPYDCPMEVRIQFVYEPPAYYQKRSKAKLRAALDGDIDCVNRTDIDNAVKAVLDAVNQVVYIDDRQVVKLTATKVWGPKAMTIADFLPRIRAKKEAA